MKTNICKIVYNREEISSLSNDESDIDFLNIRIDLFHNKNIPSWTSISSFCTIYSLRSKEQGGTCDFNQEERINNLILANENYDFIELEFPADLNQAILNFIPPEKRIISWRGDYSNKQDLSRITKEIISYEAAYYIIVPVLHEAGEDLEILEILNENNNKRLIIFGLGPLGLWTQIYSVHLGSPMVFCHSEGNNHGYFTYDKLKKDYGLPYYERVTRLYGIAGNPVYGSLSPRIHNSSYKYYGMDSLYLPFHINDFKTFYAFIREEVRFRNLGVTLEGFTMISPFKESTYRIASNVLNENSKISAAANILIKEGEDWIADSSDGYGVSIILQKENFDPAKLHVAIFGCGGAGRTIAATLKQKGCNVHLFNRSLERGIYAADILGLRYDAPEHFSEPGYNIIVNATPLGKNGEEHAFDPSLLDPSTVVIDLAYAKNETPLIRKSRLLGLKTYSGKDILLFQVAKQFHALTNKKMPENKVYGLINEVKHLVER